MANVITGKFLTIDTAGATSLIVGQQLRIIGIFWMGTEGSAIVANNDFLIEDGVGTDIIRKRALANNDGFEVYLGYPGITTNGLQVALLDAGICHIWLAEEVTPQCG